MNITDLGNMFTVEDPDRLIEFTVAKLDDKLLLYGDVGDQMFTYKGELNKKELQDAFPDRKAAARSALQHTRGIVNKEKFIKSADKLKELGKIDYETFVKLNDFIVSCNCAPVKVVAKLVAQGFASYITELDIYEESEVLVETTQALIDFINHLP